jgi:SAM-dependent methyltransferase
MAWELYNRPLYYDIAFSWELTAEIEFFASVFSQHVSFPVRRILEPACGSGRFLRTLPTFGYEVIGYDINEKMLEFANQSVKKLGLEAKATAQIGDMRSATFEPPYDAAFNSINSIGYLLTDEDIAGHFRCLGESLRSGGIYIVHLGCAYDKMPAEPESTWTMERDGVSVTTTWSMLSEDRKPKLSHQYSRLEIDDHGRKSVIEESHNMRLWTMPDLIHLTEISGWKLVALHDEKFQPLALDTNVSGELGNLYFIFRKL